MSIREATARAAREGGQRQSPESESERQALLVERSRRGDRSALGELLRLHVRQVEKTLWKLVATPEEMEEAIQEAAFVVSRRIADFRGDSSFATWFTGIALRTALRQRRLRRRRSQLQSLDEPESHQLTRGINEENRMAARQLLDKAFEQLETHSEITRTAFVMSVFEGKSVKEIAQALGKSENTVKARIAISRKKLQAELRHPRMAALLQRFDPNPGDMGEEYE